METATPTGDALPEETLSSEEREVRLWRYRQTRLLGLGRLESRLVAESDADLGLLRRLVANGCPPRLALQITL